MALITGNGGNNYLDGTIGDDTIYGLDGNDTLVGNAGTDSLVGGNGDDRYWVKDAGDIVVENGTGYDAVWSEISYTLTANVEELDLLGTANINAPATVATTGSLAIAATTSCRAWAATTPWSAMAATTP